MKLLVKCLTLFLSAFLLSMVPALAESDLKPSRDNFFRELLDAKATSVTPRFNDYTEGSYHVDKLDVLKGLSEVAQKEGLKLRGLIVVGPVGPLWAYYVVAFIEEAEAIRVNSITMPHARITYKSTGTISQKRYNSFLSGLMHANLLATELPPKGKCDTCPYPEWHYEVLLSDSSKPQASVYYGSLKQPRPSSEAGTFHKRLDSLLSSLRQTYPVKRVSKSRSRRA
jgi:hypothetical protein